MFKTLEELKAENAAAESEPVAVDEQQEVDQPEEDEEVADAEVEESGEGQAEESTEEWLKEESDEKAVPLAKHIATKHKLRGQIEEKDSVIEQLRREVEQLKQAKPVAAAQTDMPRMPRLSDFDYDEDRHAEALMQYQEQLIERKLSNTLSSKQQEQEQERQISKITQAVESHYERAAKLIEQGLITEDKYAAADKRFRQELDSVTGAGDVIADNIIARLGEGSEKVITHLGVNQNAMQKLKGMLVDDPTGLTAAVYLGQLNAQFNSPSANKLSKAPKPDGGLKGDKGGVSTVSSAILKQYKDAHKSGDIAKAIQIKLKAKQNGTDTSNW